MKENMNKPCSPLNEIMIVLNFLRTHFQPEAKPENTQATLWLLAVQSTLRMSEQNLGSGVNRNCLEDKIW